MNNATATASNKTVEEVEQEVAKVIADLIRATPVDRRADLMLDVSFELQGRQHEFTNATSRMIAEIAIAHGAGQ